jgi:hypothetical protein
MAAWSAAPTFRRTPGATVNLQNNPLRRSCPGARMAPRRGDGLATASPSRTRKSRPAPAFFGLRCRKTAAAAPRSGFRAATGVLPYTILPNWSRPVVLPHDLPFHKRAFWLLNQAGMVARAGDDPACTPYGSALLTSEAERNWKGWWDSNPRSVEASKAPAMAARRHPCEWPSVRVSIPVRRFERAVS